MSYSAGAFSIDDTYAGVLWHKLEAFREETKTPKALHLTIVSVDGLSKNNHSDMVVNEITADDLFGRN